MAKVHIEFQVDMCIEVPDASTFAEFIDGGPRDKIKHNMIGRLYELTMPEGCTLEDYQVFLRRQWVE